MNIASIIADIVAADPAVIAFPGMDVNNITTGHVEPDTNTPYIVCMYDNDDPGYTINGSAGYRNSAVTIFCIHDKFSTADQLGEVVADIFRDGLTGTYDSIFIQSAKLDTMEIAKAQELFDRPHTDFVYMIDLVIFYND